MNRNDNTSQDDLAHRVLKRLFLLRNITILGASTAIAIASIPFDLALPLKPLLLTLALLAVLNLLTGLRLRSALVISNTEIFAQMLLDIVAFTSLFYFTGGASNPFIWFYLLPLIIAATILPRGYTWTMAILTVACYSTVFIYNVPLPSGGMQHDGGFQMHVFGMWLGFVMSAGFVAVIIVGMAEGLRKRDRKLADARELALKNERLAAMGTLAAGAAHELGTPLGTMAILTTELEQEYVDPAHSDLQKKLGILHQQIDRCKEALSVMSTAAGAGRAESGHRMPVGKYLGEVINEWQSQHPDTRLDYRPGENDTDGSIVAERSLTQALVNVLDNAAAASPEEITLAGSWNTATLSLEISDRGPGMSSRMQEQLGKVPVTSRTGGLGMGLYLANATIQRLGGSLAIEDRQGGGTSVRISLPLLADRPGQ